MQKALLIASLVVAIVSCQTRESEYRKIIGQQYYSLTQFKPFINFSHYNSSYILQNDTPVYAISHYNSGDVNVIAFEKIVNPSWKSMKYALLDLIELRELKPNQQLAYGICRLNGKFDPQILAVYEMPDADAEFFTQIVKTWRVNTATFKIEEISTNGVDCVNEVYGEE